MVEPLNMTYRVQPAPNDQKVGELLRASRVTSTNEH